MFFGQGDAVRDNLAFQRFKMVRRSLLIQKREKEIFVNPLLRGVIKEMFLRSFPKVGSIVRDQTFPGCLKEIEAGMLNEKLGELKESFDSSSESPKSTSCCPNSLSWITKKAKNKQRKKESKAFWKQYHSSMQQLEEEELRETQTSGARKTQVCELFSQKGEEGNKEEEDKGNEEGKVDSLPAEETVWGASNEVPMATKSKIQNCEESSVREGLRKCLPFESRREKMIRLEKERESLKELFNYQMAYESSALLNLPEESRPTHAVGWEKSCYGHPNWNSAEGRIETKHPDWEKEKERLEQLGQQNFEGDFMDFINWDPKFYYTNFTFCEGRYGYSGVKPREFWTLTPDGTPRTIREVLIPEGLKFAPIMKIILQEKSHQRERSKIQKDP